MTVTRDVILDLLPLYFAGQVTADTKALVDEFLETDPDFARMSQRCSGVLKDRQPTSEEAAAERRTFERVRRVVRRRNQVIGLAAAFSMMPLTFGFHGDRIDWILLRDQPAVAAAFLAAGVACWIVAYVIGRQATRERV